MTPELLTFEVTVKVQVQAANAGEAWERVDRSLQRHLWSWDIKTENVRHIDGSEST